MAVQFKVDHKRTSEYRFLPEDITIKPELNGRHDTPDISTLIKDILTHGQHTPVTIRNDGGLPTLVMGFSRWRAISEINQKGLAGEGVKIAIRCTYVQCSEKEGFLANIAENRFRNETTEIDDAHNIKKLLNVFAMTEEQIATQYFPTSTSDVEKKKSLHWVKARVALISLAPEAEQAVKEGRLKITAAQAIAKLSQEQQKTLVESSEGPIKGSDIAKVAGKPAATNPLKVIKAKLQAVIDTGSFLSLAGEEVKLDDATVEFLASILQ